jgi:hypothetical protein
VFELSVCFGLEGDSRVLDLDYDGMQVFPDIFTFLFGNTDLLSAFFCNFLGDFEIIAVKNLSNLLHFNKDIIEYFLRKLNGHAIRVDICYPWLLFSLYVIIF